VTSLAIGGLNSSLYEWTLILHLVLVVVGMGSSFVWPVLQARARRAGGPAPGVVAPIAADLSKLFTSIPLTLAGLVGFALIAFSDDVWEMGQLWLDLSILLWLIGIALGWLVMGPSQKKAVRVGAALASGTATDPVAATAELARLQQRIKQVGGFLHLDTTVLVVLMVLKPM
jgi:uncharacterized membrane protein